MRIKLLAASAAIALIGTSGILVVTRDRASVPSTELLDKAPAAATPTVEPTPLDEIRSVPGGTAPTAPIRRSRASQQRSTRVKPAPQSAPPPAKPIPIPVRENASIEGTFTVTDTPDLYLTDACDTSEGRTFTAPYAGDLTATAEHSGDWDLLLIDEDGEVTRAAYFAETPTHLRSSTVMKGLAKGEEVTIKACNYLSEQLTITVDYTFDPGGNFGDRFEPQPFTHLEPGESPELRETVPINLVFVGYQSQDISTARFRKILPEEYRPISRIPAFYGLGSYLGIEYRYDYRFHATDESYEDRLFGELTRLGERADPTLYQSWYNSEGGAETITDNIEIDAASVEKWLAQNPPPGVDPAEYTVFFINWYGRPDFNFHVYTKYGEPDTDTGTHYAQSDLQKLIAWGGTPPDDPETPLGRLARIWFYDQSAGPDGWSENWFLQGEGEGLVLPYWEYGSSGTKAKTELTEDLAKLTRYVATDLLFTTSPIYPPSLTPPDIPNSIQMDLFTYEGIPGRDSSELSLDPAEIRRTTQALLPRQKVTVHSRDLDVIAPLFMSCVSEWWLASSPQACYPDRPYDSFANLFLHHALNRDTLVSDGIDYHLFQLFYPSVAWDVTFAFADDNYWDGTQSFTHTFLSALDAERVGMSDFLIHEGGHHFGLSHPHDGYDYEDDRDFSAGMQGMTFAWVGDEVNSVMSYLFVNNDFSQFDRDNMDRWHTEGYIAAANEVAAQVIASGKRSSVEQALRRADESIGRAKSFFAAHRYGLAAAAALDALNEVRSAASEAGVVVVGSDSGFRVRGGRFAPDSAGPTYMYYDPFDLTAPGIARRLGIASAEVGEIRH